MAISVKRISGILFIACVLASNPTNAADKDVIVVNTPDVNVANTPDVTVSNTPDVNVANTPDVNVANAPDVNIVNATPIPVAAMDDYVSLRMSGEFSDGSCCLADPDTGFIPRLDVDQFGGRDLLVEYVSCQVLIPPTQPVNLYIGENGQNAPVDALIAIELSEQFQALASDSLSGTALHASHAVKVIVDSSDDLLLNGRRDVASPGVGRASCVIAGRLVN